MVDPRDRQPANRGKGAETVAHLPDGSCLLGFYVAGVKGYPMLGIKVDEFGRPVSVARFEEVAEMPAQSNPRRRRDPRERNT